MNNIKQLIIIAGIITLTACQSTLTSAVNNGEKHLVDFIRQPDGKSLGILGQVT